MAEDDAALTDADKKVVGAVVWEIIRRGTPVAVARDSETGEWGETSTPPKEDAPEN